MRLFIILLLLLLAAPILCAEETVNPVATATQAQPSSAPAQTGETKDPFASVPQPQTAPEPDRTEQTRDPFVDPYKYAAAIHRITVMGIVTADNVERIIMHIDGYDELAVMKTGDAVAVNHNGVRHEFVIKSVTPKSVRFEATPDSAQSDAVYEVFLL